ncbi:MAG: ribonuclease E inhibitor RraB [Bacteroidetes bacterium]|nr:ribonuclease E inhibitor RraB [Bacteroidota bacterium]
MSRKGANARVLELMEHFGAKNNSLMSVEFFFYANKQDDASNLLIDLSKLGYKIYTVDEPDAAKKQWAIIGNTPKMDVSETALAEWTEKMERLAIENNSAFDGWGTLIDPKGA